MQNKPNFRKKEMNPTSLLLTTNNQRLTNREAQNKPNQTQMFRCTSCQLFTLKGVPKRITYVPKGTKPNQTQLQTQADGFFKILPRLPIITRILPSHWPACPIIQPAKDDELLTVLVNLPLNPADKPNRNGLRAQNAQPFLVEKSRNQKLGQTGYIKGSKDG